MGGRWGCGGGAWYGPMGGDELCCVVVVVNMKRTCFFTPIFDFFLCQRTPKKSPKSSTPVLSWIELFFSPSFLHV